MNNIYTELQEEISVVCTRNSVFRTDFRWIFLQRIGDGNVRQRPKADNFLTGVKEKIQFKNTLNRVAALKFN